MTADFSDVQRIVLHGSRWNAARHLMLSFGDQSPLHFLCGLLKQGCPTAAAGPTPDLQFSLGFTRRGLGRAAVPDHVLANFALKAPAYWAGAAMRAARHLEMSDRNAAEHWDPRFNYLSLDAVLSVHARRAGAGLNEVIDGLKTCARKNDLTCEELPAAAALPPPPDVTHGDPEETRGQWVHFGYLDGLSRIGIKGWTPKPLWDQCLPVSRHEAGEFLLGHLQDCGADPWVAGPRLRIWPDKVRAFFRNGSFGVMQQIEQDVALFEGFVKAAATKTGLSPNEIKGKLGGRYPDGRSLAVADDADPHADFDYTKDRDGHGCPFGSHVRRMNPRLPRAAEAEPLEKETRRDDRPAHFSRARPLLRRGMPYGPPWSPDESGEKKRPRGLIGLFFCASIEDQFEHLLGEWAERVQMGSPDGGGARDPLIGAHETGDGPFELPRPAPTALYLDDLQPFTRTVGAAYLFYPSLTTLAGIADSSLWGADDADDEDGDE